MTALVIIVAHGALLVAVWNGAVTRRSREVSAITVQMLVDRPKPVDIQAVAAPRLATFAPAPQPVPELTLPADPETNAISVVAVPNAPAVPASATHGAPLIAEAASIPTMSDIAYLERPEPHYPALSRRAREEGAVWLRVVIDEQGRVSEVQIQRSSGHGRLDEAAIEAVKHARFKPYREGGVARAATAVIPIEFSLHRS